MSSFNPHDPNRSANLGASPTTTGSAGTGGVGRYGAPQAGSSAGAVPGQPSRTAAFPQASQGPGQTPFASQAPNVGLGQDSRRPSSQGPTPIEAPTVALPKGGGAVQPIAEKFSINPATGAGSMSVGVGLSPGRGLSPQMSVGYSTGGGNGPFGMGWGLSVPTIARKTDKGLPEYNDAQSDTDDDSDIFVMSGAEDLVRVLEEQPAGAFIRKPASGTGEARYRYRPRTEGSFLRIERVVTPSPRETHWEVTGADNVTHIYGKTAEARLSDPKYPGRVFQWLLEETQDDKGNVVRYEYKAEDMLGVPRTVSEAHRHDGRAEVAGRYLKRVLYGNVHAAAVSAATAATDFHFEVVLDYGEHDTDAPKPTPDAAAVWPARQDAFSSYRAGFEVRTYRLCQRILMFHRFPELDALAPGDGGSGGDKALLVRSTAFTYEERGDVTYLVKATQYGYAPDGQGGYVADSLPPAEFTYSRADAFSDKAQDLDAKSAQQLTSGPGGRAFQWVDLNGEGVAGALTQQGGGLYYKRNLGGGTLGPAVALMTQPSGAQIGGQRGGSGGVQQLIDITGDGLPDLVELGGNSPGYHARTGDGGWSPKRTFRQLPRIDFRDPSLRFLDLTGDGYADIMMSEAHVYRWYGSKSTEGFDASKQASRYSDERSGPNVVFAEAEQTVFLADMSGDGLQDLVRVRNGYVVYWPNLGHGQFGAQVVMGIAPTTGDQVAIGPTTGVHMAPTDHYDSSRVRLADIDGTGAADLIYIGAEGVSIWRNQAGNAFGPAEQLAIFPGHTNLHTVDIVDLLGTGTACLVWSTPLRGQPPQVRYVDLLDSTKPHLLISSVNNLGLETTLRYTTSTLQYLEDLSQGVAWASRIPFPVHVVDHVEHYDHISKHRFVSTYRYRHGHYDGQEREFRGFGYVEQRDAEAVGEDLGLGNLPTYPISNGEIPLAPVVTKSWYHTGAWMNGKDQTLEAHYATEWFDPSTASGGPYDAEPRLPASAMPSTLAPLEHHQARRALAGQMLRQEVYAEDGSVDADKPFVVTQQRYQVRLLQPRRHITDAQTGAGADQPHGVFLSHALESLSIHYERNPAEPRITHELVLEVDAYGYPVKTAAAAAYARPNFDANVHPAFQNVQHLTANAQTLAHQANDSGVYRHGVQVAAQSYELHSSVFNGANDNGLLDPGAVRTALDSATEVAFDAALSAGQKRLLSDTRTRYWDFSTPTQPVALAFAELPNSGTLIAYSSYAKVLTADMLTGALQSRVTAAELTEAGYLSATAVAAFNSAISAVPGGTVPSDGAQWAWSGTANYDAAAFYQVTSVRDVYGHAAAAPYDAVTITYDAHRLFAIGSTDVVGNTTAASGVDYRVLAPTKVTDINGNHALAAFDTLGRVVRTAVVGKAGAGDSIANDAVATSTISYELSRWMDSALPARITTTVRETHESVLETGETTRWLTSIAYTGGGGQTVMSKATAAQGPAVKLNVDGTPDLNANGGLQYVHSNPRWVASGRTVVDNKGNAIKQYEPYFSQTSEYEDDPTVVQWGVTPVMHYDAVGRLLRVDMPDGTYAKTTFTPWQQAQYDSNDTAKPGQIWFNAQTASIQSKMALFADTPAVTHFDTLGRPVSSVAHNRVGLTDEYQETRVAFDVSGNTLSVTDAVGRTCMSYVVDMLGQPLQQDSVDSGERRMLATAGGEPIKSWGERVGTGTGAAAVITHRAEYDKLRRPTHSWVDEGNGGGEVLTERMVYGEAHPSIVDNTDADYPNARNLRGQLVAAYDQSGVVVADDYDFKGQPHAARRHLTKDYKLIVDWAALDAVDDYDASSSAAAALLEAEVFTHSYEYDALGRPTAVTAPKGSAPTASTTYSSYNQGGQLVRVEVGVHGAGGNKVVVPFIAYDAHGRRTYVSRSDHDATGTKLVTIYGYDPLSFRLTQVKTTRAGASAATLQDLRYTYDAVGNITIIRDYAQQTVYFNGAQIAAIQTFAYDALYRLTQAVGREHAGTLEPTDAEPVVQSNPSAGSALQVYVETFSYDKVGNLTKHQHAVPSNTMLSWTRDYTYAAGSNQMATTTIPGMSTTVSYTHDAHGNLQAMPHLSSMVWDHADQLRYVDKDASNDIWFQYDGSGERIRKVWEHSGYREERLYLGGFELWRRKALAAPHALQEERETLHVSDDVGRVCMVETKTVVASAAVSPLDPRYRYQLDNHLGTVSVEVDENGNVISYEEYHPYGTSAYRASNGSTEVSAKRYRYSGKERDEETGLYYHGARYYAAWLGRWTAADPAGLADGANLYQYVSGNPVALSDPDGMQGRNPLDFEAKGVKITPLGEGGPGPTTLSDGAGGHGSGNDPEGGAKGRGPGTEPEPEPAEPEEDGRKAARPKAGSKKRKDKAPSRPPASLAIAIHKAPIDKKKRDENAFFTNEAKRLARARKGVVATKASTGAELIERLKQATSASGAIRNVVLLGHSSNNGVFMENNRGFYGESRPWMDREGGARLVSDLVTEMAGTEEKGPSVVFTDDAQVIFLSCGCAGDDESAVARRFTLETGVSTIGAKGPVEPDKKGSRARKAGFGWYRYTRVMNSEGRWEVQEERLRVSALDPAAHLILKPKSKLKKK